MTVDLLVASEMTSRKTCVVLQETSNTLLIRIK